MQYEDKVSLSKVRLETAKECLKDSRILIDSGSCKASANRSYYAVFHAMRAVLVFDEFDSKKHSGIISEFRKRYIKTGIFSSDISKIIDIQFSVRTHSDYDDFYVISKSESLNQLFEAEKTVEEIEKYLIEFYNKKN
ncbi:MAG: HEPN domain-containing protein [Faecalibacterium sp.]|nr:HEPN domain-containing protein [Ruminococcus sp.]MCM1392189.1 HEPN domain-containing protein [Ruminococcus sp.]MCM1485401.1 HEPN domain-containing protein [Faecalibacterium sp.]